MPLSSILTSPFWSGVRPFFVPTKTAPLVSSRRISTRLPSLSRAGDISYCLPFGGGWSELILICLIASGFVEMCPVE